MESSGSYHRERERGGQFLHTGRGVDLSTQVSVGDMILTSCSPFALCLTELSSSKTNNNLPLDNHITIIFYEHVLPFNYKLSFVVFIFYTKHFCVSIFLGLFLN